MSIAFERISVAFPVPELFKKLRSGPCQSCRVNWSEAYIQAPCGPRVNILGIDGITATGSLNRYGTPAAEGV